MGSLNPRCTHPTHNPLSPSHGCGQPNVDGHHLALDVLHGVEKGEPGDHTPAGGVDIEVDGLCAVLAVEVEQDADDLVGYLVVDLHGARAAGEG